MTDTLDDLMRERLAALDEDGLRRHLATTDRIDAVHVEREGRTLISFCCNDYLNLCHDPRVMAAARAALEHHGTGAGASRLITGNHSIFAELEQTLARIKGTEAALVFGAGFLANIGIIPALMGPGDLVVMDELSHACLFLGARLTLAHKEIFSHNHMLELEQILAAKRRKYQNCLIVTDGVFSMDGDLAALPQMRALADQYQCWLMTDDAHGIGVVGGGRGSSFAFDPPVPVEIQMGTLSKAVGSAGGYVCASQPVVDWLTNRARSLVYSTGLAPASAGAALEAVKIIETDAELCARPIAKARRFTRALNLPDAESAIVPVLMGDEARAMAASKMLEHAGFLVTAIRPPTVPQGTARLRFTFTAQHSDADIDRLIDAVRGVMPGDRR